MPTKIYVFINSGKGTNCQVGMALAELGEALGKLANKWRKLANGQDSYHFAMPEDCVRSYERRLHADEIDDLLSKTRPDIPLDERGIKITQIRAKFAGDWFERHPMKAIAELGQLTSLLIEYETALGLWGTDFDTESSSRQAIAEQAAADMRERAAHVCDKISDIEKGWELYR
jgi:hypothetical protein